MNNIARATARALLSLLFLASLSACTLDLSDQLAFTNPPVIGQSLPSDQRLFACDTVRGARYMASTGFMIAGCQPLTVDSAHDYRVMDVQRIDLPEGEMWQIQLIGPEGPLWMPLPWHDWA